MTSAPAVSVWIITYYHEKYIFKALESLLHQLTEFDYEIIIGKDFSRMVPEELLKSIRKDIQIRFILYYIPKGIEEYRVD